MDKRRLLIAHLEDRIRLLAPARALPAPPTGWIRAPRLALGMSLQQLAVKLGVTRQSVRNMEGREAEGGITIKSLREVAQALDMELVYGLVPRDGSLDAYIERRARRLAEEIVGRTATTMSLEDQGNTEERLRQAIEARTLALRQEMPKMLWD
jgi:predicted DNA-binding mobile mystery protein A